jgi:heme exporter protein C
MQPLINNLISPKKFFLFSTRTLPWLYFLFGISLTCGLYGGLLLAPADAIQGDGFRIIYVHVPCAFLSLLIYAVMTGAAFCLLVWRLKMAALVMRQSVSLGASFTFLALITGSLWGKPMWGTWWLWDARLTSELILLFLYVGILLFQSAVTDKPMGNRAVAILILIGSVDLPIIHYSVYWWNTLHQGTTLNLFRPSLIDKSMLYPLIAMLIAFTVYYGMILFLRIRNDLLESQYG